MINLNRRGKLLAGFAILILTFLSLSHVPYVQDKASKYTDILPDIDDIHDKISEVSDKVKSKIKPESKGKEDTSVAQIEPIKTSSLPPSLARDALFNEDAHKFKSADDFKPHFEKVYKQKNLSLREASSGCTWKFNNPDEPRWQFMNTPDTPWVKDPPSNKIIRHRRQEIYDFMQKEMKPYEQYKDRFEGRGIVIVGGERSQPLMEVLLRQLQRLGSMLPVEIHYFVDELNQTSKDALASTYHSVEFVDLNATENVYQTHFNQFFNNYHLKTGAMVNSRFAEIMMLDSDNIPVIKPEELFDTDLYKEYGTLFWPDIARNRPENPIWAIANTHCQMDMYSQESGQMLVDKRKYFYHLQVAFFLAEQHTDYYQTILLGDKDMFRFVWYALKTKYAFPPKFVTSIGTSNAVEGEKEPFYCGHSFAQHAPDGRVAFFHGGTMKSWFKVVLSWERHQRAGIFQSYKRSRNDEDHSKPGGALLKWDGGAYLPEHLKANIAGASWCTDLPLEEARPLEEILPGGFEHVFRELGGYWMIGEGPSPSLGPPSDPGSGS